MVKRKRLFITLTADLNFNRIERHSSTLSKESRTLDDFVYCEPRVGLAKPFRSKAANSSAASGPLK